MEPERDLLGRFWPPGMKSSSDDRSAAAARGHSSSRIASNRPWRLSPDVASIVLVSRHPAFDVLTESSSSRPCRRLESGNSVTLSTRSAVCSGPIPAGEKRRPVMRQWVIQIRVRSAGRRRPVRRGPVRHGDQRGVGDRGVAHEQPLRLLGVDLLHIAVDDVLDPAVDRVVGRAKGPRPRCTMTVPPLPGSSPRHHEASTAAMREIIGFETGRTGSAALHRWVHDRTRWRPSTRGLLPQRLRRHGPRIYAAR